MSQQDKINELLTRLQKVQTDVAAIEANAANNAPVDLTALTDEVAAVEAQVAQGLPAPATSTPNA